MLATLLLVGCFFLSLSFFSIAAALLHCCGEAGEEVLIHTMPLISEAPQQLGKRGPKLQLRNTMGWRPSIMLRTSDVNRGGVPPARVSTQDTTVPLYPCPRSPPRRPDR